MQRMKIWWALGLLVMAEGAAAQSGRAAVRFRCDGDSVGAAVSINGQFKGECPFDLSVPEGVLKISAVRQIGPEHERLFEQEVRVGADSMKTIEVVLGPKQISAAGRRIREEQAAAERRAREEQAAAERRAREEQAEAERRAREARLSQEAEVERKRAALFERQRMAAEGGHVEAMVALADAYREGLYGLPTDHLQAFAWYEKAANAGNSEAMYRMSERTGDERQVGTQTAQDWLRKAMQAGHRGAEERWAQLPRYCYASVVKVKTRFFSAATSTLVSPVFEDEQADGSDVPVRAALLRYAEQWDRLQSGGRRDEKDSGMECYANRDIASCHLFDPPFISMSCGTEAKIRAALVAVDEGLRKDGGNGTTLLPEWRGQ